MSAEIINFPGRGEEDGSTADPGMIEAYANVIERLSTQAATASNVRHLLMAMERLSELLIQLGDLLLDNDGKQRLQRVFESLSAGISEARQLLIELDGE